MKSNTPILTIALQIPVTPDVDVEGILEAVSTQLQAALEQIRANGLPDGAESEEVDEAEEIVEPDPEQIAFKLSLIRETAEEFTEETRADLLSTMGYRDPKP